MPFYNQEASLNTTPNFTPDGKQIYYASSASGTTQIFAANIDGQGFRRITHRDAICVEPKVNPKNPNFLLFVSGPSAQQIYRMNADGADVQRITNGEGEASNPSWSPDGQRIAFSWTRGYAKGDWNIFVMDVGSGQYTQLTHSEGKNENPPPPAADAPRFIQCWLTAVRSNSSPSKAPIDIPFGALNRSR